MGIIENEAFTREDFKNKRFFGGYSHAEKKPGYSSPYSEKTAAVPFLQETSQYQVGKSYNFFEITNLTADAGKIEVEADILFVDRCRDIKLQALLYDMNHLERPIKELEVQECQNKNSLSYHAVSDIPERNADELGVVMQAAWESDSQSHGEASILEGTGYDHVVYNHVHPAHQSPYMRFPQNGAAEYFDAKAQANDDGNRDTGDYIVIALYRNPGDTRDLDYLCEYGWEGGKPRLMVPGQGTITFKDTRINPDSVKAVCYLYNLGNKGVVAAAVNDDPEYTNENITINAGESSISYSMLKPWSKPFQECNRLVNHLFSYNMLITYKRKNEDALHPLYITNHPVKNNYIWQVPDLIIKWGCLLEDTKILMGDGSLREIREIACGDKVMGEVACGDRVMGKIACDDKVMGLDSVPVEVKNVWKGQEECCYGLKTETGFVCSSPGHPFLTEAGYRRADSLKPGDRVKCIDVETGTEAWVSLVSVEKKEQSATVYSLDLEGASMVANGFVSGDFTRQNEMV